MRGLFYSTDNQLCDRDLGDLADALAIKLHNLLGARVFHLQRADVAELIEPYIRDLHPEDHQALIWIVWHLFQDARDIWMEELYSAQHRRGR